MKTFWGAWTNRRINKLPEFCSTSEVRDGMRIHERTLRHWLSDPYFLQAEVAKQVGTHWVWSREKLWLWLIAMGAIKPARIVAQNPPPRVLRTPAREVEMDKLSAREELGIPADYAMRNQPKKKKKAPVSENGEPSEEQELVS